MKKLVRISAKKSMRSSIKSVSHLRVKYCFVEKGYQKLVQDEYAYFEYINVIRMTARRIMTHVNPNKQIKKFETLLNELKEIYFSNSVFSGRFLEEEIRDS